MKEYQLELIANCVRKTRARIEADETVRRDRGDHLEQLRGVRRLAAHLADELCDLDEEKIAFLKSCGYA